MGWKQWSAVAVVIGGGILFQIPRHDAVMDQGAMQRGDVPTDMADVEETFRTVALDVTGMT